MSLLTVLYSEQDIMKYGIFVTLFGRLTQLEQAERDFCQALADCQTGYYTPCTQIITPDGKPAELRITLWLDEQNGTLPIAAYAGTRLRDCVLSLQAELGGKQEPFEVPWLEPVKTALEQLLARDTRQYFWLEREEDAFGDTLHHAGKTCVGDLLELSRTDLYLLGLTTSQAFEISRQIHDSGLRLPNFDKITPATPLHFLFLTREINLLHAAGIVNVGDLCRHTPPQLRQIDKLGAKTLETIISTISPLALKPESAG